MAVQARSSATTTALAAWVVGAVASALMASTSRVLEPLRLPSDCQGAGGLAGAVPVRPQLAPRPLSATTVGAAATGTRRRGTRSFPLGGTPVLQLGYLPVAGSGVQPHRDGGDPRAAANEYDRVDQPGQLLLGDDVDQAVRAH